MHIYVVSQLQWYIKDTFSRFNGVSEFILITANTYMFNLLIIANSQGSFFALGSSAYILYKLSPFLMLLLARCRDQRRLPRLPPALPMRPPRRPIGLPLPPRRTDEPKFIPLATLAELLEAQQEAQQEEPPI